MVLSKLVALAVVTALAGQGIWGQHLWEEELSEAGSGMEGSRGSGSQEGGQTATVKHHSGWNSTRLIGLSSASSSLLSTS